MLITEAAINHGQSASPCPLKKESARAIGIFSKVVMKIIGARRSFHEVTNETIPSAVRAGFESGRKICQKTAKGLAPSRIAASFRSRGVPKQNWRIREMP